MKRILLLLYFFLMLNQIVCAGDDINYLLQKAIYSPYEQAVVYIDKVLEVEPQNAAAYKILASKYFEAGEVEQALTAINKAISINPDDAEAYRWRATFLRKMGDAKGSDNDVKKSKEIEKKQFKDDLLKSKKKVTARNSKEKKSLRNEIYRLINKKNYQAAINLFEKYTEIEKKPNLTILYEIAYAYEQVNDLTSAINIYTKCIELYSPNSDFYQRRARLKKIIGDTAGAAMDKAVVDSLVHEKSKDRIAEYDKVIKENPERRDVYIEKAKELVEIGEFKEALEAIDKALTLFPTENKQWEDWLERFRKKIQKKVEKVNKDSNRNIKD